MSNKEVLGGEICPFCHNKTLTLIEEEMEIPYFGKVFMFSMSCTSCNFYKSDVEAANLKDPCSITFEVESEEDMKVRLVKSSTATIKIPGLKMSVTPGPASLGYVSNIEGMLNRFKSIIEKERDSSDEPDVVKNAKNLLKKLRKAMWGEAKLKIMIDDPSGNSAIISDRAVVKKLKGKK